MKAYLDWNATTRRHPGVRQAMQRAEEHAWANPSSVHSLGRRARRELEDARELLASCFRVSPRDVVFTGGGTEANHLALNGVQKLVTSRIEHPSIVAQAEALAAGGAQVEFVEVDSEGLVAPESIRVALQRLIGPEGRASIDSAAGGLNNSNTPLVAVMAVNHETGVLQPIQEIADVTHALGARLHVDAIQLVGRGDLSLLEAADSVAIAAHKIRGPKGIGALAFECGWTPLPLTRGGAQERGLRPGTLDATLIAGFAAALDRLEESTSNYLRIGALRAELETALLTQANAAVLLHGAQAKRLGHVSNFRVQGWKGDELVAALDLEGICISSGSACSAGSSEPSAVVSAMLGTEVARGAVRVSFGEESSDSDLRALLEALRNLGVLTRIAQTR